MAHRKGMEQGAHINVRLPEDLAKRLRERAESEQRSVSGEVRMAVLKHLEVDDAKVAA